MTDQTSIKGFGKWIRRLGRRSKPPIEPFVSNQHIAASIENLMPKVRLDDSTSGTFININVDDELPDNSSRSSHKWSTKIRTNTATIQDQLQNGSVIPRPKKTKNGQNGALYVEDPSQPSFIYSSLDESKSEIRLLSIEPDPESSPIRCTLKHASCIHGYPEYTALSYCWGSSEHPRQIIVNGQSVLVTVNLEHALRDLRRIVHTPIWVDAICVNQRDLDERGRQVLRMKDLFANAALTIAWLGSDSGAYAASAFGCLQVLRRGRSEPGFDGVVEDIKSWLSERYTKPSIREVIAFRQMIMLNYWARTWIIQELALSRNVKFLWGQVTMDADTLREGWKGFMKYKPWRSPAGWAWIKGVLSLMRRLHEGGEESMTFNHALSYSSPSEASDSRDKIFGIIGLCSDGSELVPHPDYNKSLDTVLWELRIAQLRQPMPRRMDLMRPMDLICIDNPNVSKRPELPSWVTDWTAIWSDKHGQHLSTTYRRGLNSEYLACGTSSHTLVLSDNGLVLIASGFTFDSIHSLSTKLDNEEPVLTPKSGSSDESCVQNNPYGSSMATYNAVWRTLIRDRRFRTTSEIAPAVHGLCFPNLYSTKGLSLLSERPRDTRNSIALARDFVILGRTVYEWTQFGQLLANQAHNQVMGVREEESRNSQTNDEDLKDFLRCVRLGNLNERLITTSKGYMGMGHCQTRAGDRICLLQGCTVPMVLRQCEGGWKVVGECYIHGIMDGQFWAEQDESKMEEFHLT